MVLVVIRLLSLQRSGFGDGQFITLTRGANAKMMSDAYSHPVMEYTINHNDMHINVRLTDITESEVPTPSMDELLCMHQKSSSFTDYYPSETKGVKFPSIKVPLGNKVVERILGATNQTRQFIAAQCSGRLQINENRPLYVDVASVALSVNRGMNPDPYNDYLEFYRLVNGELVFTMLVEVLVDNEVILSCVATKKDHLTSISEDGPPRRRW